jgi:transcriptional regulator with XRE-family HTH domain
MITGAQMRAARALIRWTVQDLAKGANVSVMTVRRAEANDGQVKMLPNNLAAIRAALESAGVEFTNDDAPGVKLRRLKPGNGTEP